MKRQFRSCGILLAGAALALGAGCADASITAASHAKASAAYGPGGPQGRFAGARGTGGRGEVSLEGGMLTRDGQPWQLRGVGISGVVTPLRQLNRAFVAQRLRQAHANFGPHLVNQVRAYGADTVVIKVSQPGLDPSHPIYDPAYRQTVVDAIRMFRNAGLTVMISMQWEPGAGSKDEVGFPTQSTENAWTALLGALPQNDGGLIFDLFNEPMGDGNAPGLWQQWKSVHEHLIATIRNAGFHRQVVVVSGLQAGHWLRGAPAILDPDGKVVYGVHPYLNAGKVGFSDPANWDTYFGQFCTRHTCMATEWGLAGLPNGINIGCTGDAPALSRRLIEYLWNHRMGIGGWSFDYPDTLMVGTDLSRPTDFTAWSGQCPAGKTDNVNLVPGFGIGKMLSDWFRSHPE